MWVFLLFVYGKTIFFRKDKDSTLTYLRLIGFMASFVYLGFLDKRLYLGPSLFPVHGYLYVKVLPNLIFGFLVIYFVGGYLTTWSRGSYQLVLELGSKNQVISFIFFLVSFSFLSLVVFDSVFYYFMSRAY